LRPVVIGGVFAAVGVSGCAHYEAKPLTPAAVEQALSAPDSQALRVEAARLQHPALQSLQINPTRGFTPEEAAVVAVLANPDLRAQRDQRGLAAAQLLRAGLLPNPTLVGGIDLPYASSPPDNHTAYTIGPEWEVTSLITREQKRRAAASSADAVELDVAWHEWQVAQAARTAAYDVLALEAQLAAARQAQRQLDDNLAAVRRAADRHEKTLLDLSSAETAARDAQAAVVALERDLAHQRLALNQALGYPPSATVTIRSDADPALPYRLDPPPPEALIAALDERRLDLVALRRGYDSQDAALRATILAQFPKVTLGFSAARDTSNVHTIGFGVTMDIPLFDRNQGAIATESATRQKLFDEYVGRVFAARADIATAVSDIRGTNAQIAAAQEAIPGLERLVRAYDAALNQGNADVLSFYQALGALWQKRVEVVKLQQQLMQNWIALELAAGQYLPPQRSNAQATASTTATTRGSAP
jgi:outer membrane protein TolC